jgi:hypothetical protein
MSTPTTGATTETDRIREGACDVSDHFEACDTLDSALYTTTTPFGD